MSEATLIFPNMRGGCATVGNKVHALFRVNGRRPGISAAHKGAVCSDANDRAVQGDAVEGDHGRSAVDSAAAMHVS